MIKIRYPKKINSKKLENFFIKKGLKKVVELSKGKDLSTNQMIVKQPYKPDLIDLYRLYQFILLNKRTTILEFGTGWSTLIFYIAMRELKKKYSTDLIQLRRNNPFEIFVIDNQKKYLELSKKRVKNFFKNKNLKLNFNYSTVVMEKFKHNIVTGYKRLPLCNPDFIYLDGPDQFEVKGNINGIHTRHKDMMPMSADILKIEYYLTPGTIIVVDGRSANAKFLKDNLTRNWIYKNDFDNDQHIFLLNDPILGKYNFLQNDFYSK